MKNRRQALHRVTERTESRRQWPTPAEFARRVSPATAARRRCPDRAGHVAPERALTSPASARVARAPFSLRLGRPSSQQQPSSSAPRAAVAIANASHPRRFSSTATAPPAPPRLTASTRARQSRLVSLRSAHMLAGAPPPPPVAVARPSQTTPGHESARTSFLVVCRCSA